MNENLIRKGDWFTCVNVVAELAIHITQGKAYQCTKITDGELTSKGKVHFIDDKGSVDYHYESMFTKVPDPSINFAVGEKLYITEGSCTEIDISANEMVYDVPYEVARITHGGSFLYFVKPTGERFVYSCHSSNFTRVRIVKKPEEDSFEDSDLSVCDECLDLIGKSLKGSIGLIYLVKSYNPVTRELQVEYSKHSEYRTTEYFQLETVRNALASGAWKIIRKHKLTATAEGDYNTIRRKKIELVQNFTEVEAEEKLEGKENVMSIVPAPDLAEEDGIVDVKTKTPPALDLHTRHWQKYCAYTENYSTQPEEEPIMKNNQQITITVPMSAYAETKTITSYGSTVRVDDEAALVEIITRIDADQEKLKVVNKNAKSSRITGQINKLGSARTKITALLDALPDEEGKDVS